MTDGNVISAQRKILSKSVPQLVNSRWLKSELVRFCESYRQQRSQGWLDWVAEQGQGEQGRQRIMQLLRQMQAAQSKSASPAPAVDDSGPNEVEARRIAYRLTKPRKHPQRKKKQGR